jgi:hypothetical protein
MIEMTKMKRTNEVEDPVYDSNGIDRGYSHGWPSTKTLYFNNSKRTDRNVIYEAEAFRDAYADFLDINITARREEDLMNAVSKVLGDNPAFCVKEFSKRWEYIDGDLIRFEYGSWKHKQMNGAKFKKKQRSIIPDFGIYTVDKETGEIKSMDISEIKKLFGL